MFLVDLARELLNSEQGPVRTDVHIVNPRSKAKQNGKKNPAIVLFVNGMAGPSLARLRTRLGLDPKDATLEWFSRTAAFSERVRRLPRDIGIAVIFIPNEGDRKSVV